MNSVRRIPKPTEAMKSELLQWCNTIDSLKIWVDNTGAPSSESEKSVASFVLTPIPHTKTMILSLSILCRGQLRGNRSKASFRKLMDELDRAMILDARDLYKHSEAIPYKIDEIKGYFFSLWGVRSDSWFIKRHNCHRLFFIPKNAIGVLHDTIFSYEMLKRFCEKSPGLSGIYIDPPGIYYSYQDIIAPVQREPIVTQKV